MMLFLTEKEMFIQKKQKQVYSFLSKFILKNLEEEEFNGEILFTFYSYLIFGVIKARIENIGNLDAFLFEYLNNKNTININEENNEISGYFTEIISDNIENLKLMSFDLYDSNQKENFLWLSEWILFCKKYFKHYNSNIDVLFEAVNDHFQIDFPFHILFLRIIFT